MFWKAARVGERLSPYIALGCFFMAVSSSSGMRDYTIWRLIYVIGLETDMTWNGTTRRVCKAFGD